MASIKITVVPVSSVFERLLVARFREINMPRADSLDEETRDLVVKTLSNFLRGQVLCVAHCGGNTTITCLPIKWK